MATPSYQQLQEILKSGTDTAKLIAKDIIYEVQTDVSSDTPMKDIIDTSISYLKADILQNPQIYLYSKTDLEDFLIAI